MAPVLQAGIPSLKRSLAARRCANACWPEPTMSGGYYAQLRCVCMVQPTWWGVRGEEGPTCYPKPYSKSLNPTALGHPSS